MMFQFQTGSISSLVYCSGFNSKLVRLESLRTQGISINHSARFNSKLVRLESNLGWLALRSNSLVSIPNWFDLGQVMMFQFQTGSIRSTRP